MGRATVGATPVARRSPAPPRTRVRHVVVDGLYPGVLVSWRRDAEGWTGDVAYVVDDRLIVEAIPATRLSPLGLGQVEPRSDPVSQNLPGRTGR